MTLQSVPIRTRMAVPKRENWQCFLPEHLRHLPREQAQSPERQTTLPPRPHLVGYVYVSTFGCGSESEASQTRAVERRVTRGDFKQHFVGCFIETTTSPKEVPFDERPYGRLLLRELQPGDGIIVDNLDRLGTTLTNIHQTIRRFVENGVDVIVLNFHWREIDTRTTAGKQVIDAIAAYLKFEHHIRSERRRKIVAYRKAHGLVYCAEVPLGKRFVRDRYGQTMWVGDRRQCAILKQIHILHRDRHMSYNDIAKLFARRGIVDQNGHPWAWPIRSSAKPRYKTHKIARAYRYVEHVLGETGQFPQPGPRIRPTCAKPRAKKVSLRERRRRMMRTRLLKKYLDYICKSPQASRRR